MSLEDKIERLASSVEQLQTVVAAQTTLITRLRDELKPKLLGRGAVAEMLGISPANLRMHLSRKSKLGETLVQLARRGMDGRQAWSPSDIAAHCRPWLGRGDEANDEASP